MGRDVKQMSIGDGCIVYEDEMGMIAKLGRIENMDARTTHRQFIRYLLRLHKYVRNLLTVTNISNLLVIQETFISHWEALTSEQVQDNVNNFNKSNQEINLHYNTIFQFHSSLHSERELIIN